VWWGEPPLPGGVRKRRPFVVVSADAFNANPDYPKVMVVHLTSVRRLGGPYPWEVDLPRGAAGLPRASIAKCAEVYTLLKRHLVETSGTLPGEQLDRIDRALAVALSLPLAAGSP
jgi:mRNA-degrading endonuclease toxin of MazEF toxin-antitoxin module